MVEGTTNGRHSDRDAVVDAFALLGNNEIGFDHNEPRCWHGLPRDMSLVILAFAMLAVIHNHANTVTPLKTSIRPDAPDFICWSVQEIRRIAIRLAQRRIWPVHVIT